MEIFPRTFVLIIIKHLPFGSIENKDNERNFIVHVKVLLIITLELLCWFFNRILMEKVFDAINKKLALDFDILSLICHLNRLQKI